MQLDFRNVRIGLTSVLLSIVGAVELHPQGVQFTGCYDLWIGPWTPSLEIGGDSLYSALPTRIFLDSIPGGDVFRPAAFAVRPVPGFPPSVHRYASWRMIAANSLSLRWTTGYSGVGMELAGSGDMLQGTAETFWDFPRKVQVAPVEARRVACTSPAPIERTAYRRLTRAVELISGQVLELGKPPPEQVLDLLRGSPRNGEVHIPPVGLFGGAEFVRVDLDQSGSLRGLSIVYPTNYDFDELIERLTAAFGPPTRPLGSQIGSSVTWNGRDSTVYVAKGTAVWVGLTDPRQ